MEDADMGIRIKLGNLKTKFLKYRIKGKIGETLGDHASIRTLRGIINEVYLNYKYPKIP